MKREPIPVQDPPTFLRIANPKPHRVYAGRSFTLKFETDARPEYFQNPDNFIAIISPPALGQYTGTASVRDGYGVAYFKAQTDVEIGTTGSITLELRPPRHTSLSDAVDVVLSEVPQNAGGQQGDAQTPNINPRFVTEHDLFYKEQGWNKTSVALVNREDTGVDIFVSASNERLESLITRAQRRDSHAVDNIKNFYLEHISYYALLQDIERTRKQPSSESGETQQGTAVPEKMVTEASLRHACDTVCGIMDGIFEVLTHAPSDK